MPCYDLGAVSDFPENEPAKASTACRDLVVVRRGEAFFVLDHNCQHLGAPLSDGIVEGDSLVCPWHRAVFRLADGHLEEPPGCMHQRRYEHRVEEGRLKVDIEPSEECYRHTGFAEPVGREELPASVAILGAGAAGMTAALTLAEAGYPGAVTIVSHESDRTFDRTKISKSLVHDVEEIALDAFRELRSRLDFRHDTVAAIDLDARSLRFADDSTLAADAIILAPGGEPRRPEIPGLDLGGVHVIRSPEDAVRLAGRVSEARRVAIIGGGFIGMEAAALLSGEDLEVTIIARDDVPLAKVLGKRLGRRLLREQEDAGVRYRGGAEVERIAGDGNAAGVVLAGGETVEADIVIVAIGVAPRTGLLQGAELLDDGGIEVEADFSVPGRPGVYAAGDVARVASAFGAVRIEHWRWAQQTGRIAAHALMGIKDDVAHVAPFFWTKQHAPGSYVYIGHAEDFSDIRYEGDPDGGEFIAYYLDGGRCLAVSAFGMPDKVSRIERAMARRGPLPEGELDSP